MNILSIQSHVAYGHVGNSAAVFPLQRIGVEVWPVHTVQFSNHTGYGAWRGRVFSGEAIRVVVQGIEERGVLGECDGVISGYLGSADTGEAVVESVARVKGANPAARYCCDPVIGDVGRGVFVRRGIPEFIKERMLPIADVVTPNQFELDYLVGRPSATHGRCCSRPSMRCMRCGPRVVLVTSLHTDDTPGRRARPRRLRRDRPLPPAHAAAARRRQRRRRRHRGAVLRASSAAPARPPRPCRWRLRRSSACSTAPPKPARARCCWSRRRRNS